MSFVHLRETPQQPQYSLRFQIAPPGSTAAEFLTISPDGRRLAFVASNGGSPQVLYGAQSDKL